MSTNEPTRQESTVADHLAGELPGLYPVDPDGCAAMSYDFGVLDEIPRGAVLSLEKHRGEFLVVNRKEVPRGTVQAIDVVDKQGNEYRLDVVALGGGRYFDMSLGHETAPVKMADNLEDVRDFDVLRRDQEWLEEYLAAKYPHSR